MKRNVLFLMVLGVAGCQQSGKTDDEVLARLDKLEAEQKRMSEVDAFVRPIMDQQKQQQNAEAAREPDPNARFAVDISGNDMHGPADAHVTIVEAWDYACPYCMRVSPTIAGFVDEYKGKVRVVFKNLVIHPDTAMPAHLAGCAAGKQGKFKEFNDAFWEKGFGKSQEDPKAMSKENILAIAKELGMDPAKLATDMDGEECKKRIADDQAELRKFQVGGTPAFFVNGKFTMFSGPEAFKALIDAEIKEVEKSGVAAGDYYSKVVMSGEKQFKSKAPAPAGGAAAGGAPAGHGG